MAKSKRAQLMQKQYIEAQEIKDDVVIVNYSDAERMRHQSWCIANDIIIYVVLRDNHSCQICINICGSEEVGAHVYKVDLKTLKAKDANWSKVIKALYTEKYLQYKKDKNEN